LWRRTGSDGNAGVGKQRRWGSICGKAAMWSWKSMYTAVIGYYLLDVLNLLFKSAVRCPRWGCSADFRLLGLHSRIHQVQVEEKM
jgi:hypothetical protein